MIFAVPSRMGTLGCTALFLFLGGCSESKSSTGPVAAESPSPAASQDKVEPLQQDAETAQTGEQKSKTPPAKQASAPQISGEAFRMAAYEGRLDTVRSAVEAGIDVNGKDPVQSLTALHMAAYNGHTETVRYLIEKGATVDCRDSEGKTPLIHACTGPFAKAALALIEAGADVNARENTEGFTPLMMAAGLGQPEVVKVLLEHNADKSLVDEDQESAADHATNSGHTDIVAMLK